MGQYFSRKIYNLTGYLFARPSFTGGLATALDLGGTLIEYNQSRSPQEADVRALATDWAIVGIEIGTASQQIGTQTRQQ